MCAEEVTMVMRTQHHLTSLRISKEETRPLPEHRVCLWRVYEDAWRTEARGPHRSAVL